MKKFIYGVSFLALVGIAFTSCENAETYSNESQNLFPRSQADDVTQMINELLANDYRGYSAGDVQKYQTDYYKIASVNFTKNDISENLLLITYLSSNYVTLKDNQNVRFVKMDDQVSITDEDDSVTLVDNQNNDGISYTINGGMLYTCVGSSCTWSQLSVDHFQCGVSSAVDLSTSDGCIIRSGSNRK
jgi:hypothetical protein